MEWHWQGKPKYSQKNVEWPKDRSRVFDARSRLLTAWAMARSKHKVYLDNIKKKLKSYAAENHTSHFSFCTDTNICSSWKQYVYRVNCTNSMRPTHSYSKQLYVRTHRDLAQCPDPELTVPWRQSLSRQDKPTVRLVSGIPVGKRSHCSNVMNHLSINRSLWANEKSARVALLRST